MNILDQLAAYARVRVETKKQDKSLGEIREAAEQLPKGDFAFRTALKKPGLSFICECKKASPSKGLIAPYFPYLQIAKEYEAAGADCLSVLTEPKWFLGHDHYLQEIAQAVKIPCLRKDFTVDEYMIYEAKLLGAKAVLLICAISTDKELKAYLKICNQLGLDALVEAHNEEEVQRALAVGARIIGVNNRNLKDFSVDTNNSAKLRALIPPEILYISESGIKTKEDVDKVKDMGADGVLIGEALMRSGNIAKTLAEMRGGL
jgi:indole-3-glycerol phosphate synthase